MMAASYSSETTAEQVIENVKSQIKGKVVLTTGVSPGGLGAYFVEAILQAEPKLLILAGRSLSKVEATAAKISSSASGVAIRTLKLDLGSQKQIREAAAEVNAYEETIDVLVNNAGVMATDYATTSDGLEAQFGINHIGTWLFTNLIMEKVLASSNGGRVVMVSSDGYRLSPIRFHDYGFHKGESYNKWRAYGQAKTGNILTAISLAEKLGRRDLVAVSLHPGVIHTNLSQHLNWGNEFSELNAVDKQMGNAEGWMSGFSYKSPGQGVATHVYAAFDPSLKDHNGRYLSDCGVPAIEKLYGHITNKVEADKLWRLSEELTGERFEYS